MAPNFAAGRCDRKSPRFLGGCFSRRGDNRVGAIGQSEILLRAGYSVVMMVSGLMEKRRRDGHLRVGWSATTPERSWTRWPPPSTLHTFCLGESMGAGIALQSAGVDPRIEAVVAEAPFASLREASYDYAGLQEYPLLGKTLFAPGAWMILYRGGKLAGFPASGVSPENAVAARNFPVLLICDEADTTLPCRHAKRIYAAAQGRSLCGWFPGRFTPPRSDLRRKSSDSESRLFRQPVPSP